MEARRQDSFPALTKCLVPGQTPYLPIPLLQPRSRGRSIAPLHSLAWTRSPRQYRKLDFSSVTTPPRAAQTYPFQPQTPPTSLVWSLSLTRESHSQQIIMAYSSTTFPRSGVLETTRSTQDKALYIMAAQRMLRSSTPRRDFNSAAREHPGVTSKAMALILLFLPALLLASVRAERILMRQP